MNLVAEESVFLALVPPGSVNIGVDLGTATIPLTRTGLFAKAIGIGSKMSGIDGSIAPDDDLQHYSLGNQLVKSFIENILAEAVTEVGEGAVGRSLEEVKAAEETKSGIVAQG